jgi:hypothetical protein
MASEKRGSPPFWGPFVLKAVGVVQLAIDLNILIDIDGKRRRISNVLKPGLPDFYCYNIPKREKTFRITRKYSKWP